MFFQSNVFPQTPDPDPGAGVYKSYETGEQKNQSLVTSRSQLEPQHKIQTLAESPELSAHQLASFTSMAPRPGHLKLLVTTHHQGNICYTYIIFHTIFLSVVTVARMLSNTALFLYNDNIQSPMYPVPTASGPCVADVTLLAVGKL